MPNDPRRTVAFVLPVFDEAGGIVAFHRDLIEATDCRPDLGFEFVYVDDGSRDDSYARLLQLREADPASPWSRSHATTGTRSPSPLGWTSASMPTRWS